MPDILCVASRTDLSEQFPIHTKTSASVTNIKQSFVFNAPEFCIMVKRTTDRKLQGRSQGHKGFHVKRIRRHGRSEYPR